MGTIGACHQKVEEKCCGGILSAEKGNEANDECEGKCEDNFKQSRKCSEGIQKSRRDVLVNT